jgi:hypothetical protein
VLADIEHFQSKEPNRYKLASVGALELAIYFMSLCSITNEEARNLGLGDRSSLIEQYRNATETAISEAELLQHPDLIVLQAFVIYLVGSSS